MSPITFSREELTALGIDVDSVDVERLQLRDPFKHVLVKFEKKGRSGEYYYQPHYFTVNDRSDAPDRSIVARRFLDSDDTSAEFDLQFYVYDGTIDLTNPANLSRWVPCPGSGVVHLTIEKSRQFIRSSEKAASYREKMYAKLARRVERRAAHREDTSGLTGWGKFLHALHLQRKAKVVSAEVEAVEIKKGDEIYKLKAASRELIKDWKKYARLIITRADGTPLTEEERHALYFSDVDDQGRIASAPQNIGKIVFSLYYENYVDETGRSPIPFDGSGEAHYLLRFFSSAEDTSLRKTWEITIKKSRKLARMEKRAQKRLLASLGTAPASAPVTAPAPPATSAKVPATTDLPAGAAAAPEGAGGADAGAGGTGDVNAGVVTSVEMDASYGVYDEARRETVGALQYKGTEEWFTLYPKVPAPAHLVRLIEGERGIQYEYLPASTGSSPAVRISGLNFVLIIKNPSVLGINSADEFEPVAERTLKVEVHSRSDDASENYLDVFVPPPQQLRPLEFTFEYTPMENDALLTDQTTSYSGELPIDR
jgi:hypothetical protein